MSKKYQRDDRNRSRQQQNWPGQSRWQGNQREGEDEYGWSGQGRNWRDENYEGGRREEFGGQWSRGQQRQNEWDDRTESERWQGGEQHWGNAPRDWGRGEEGWQGRRSGGWQQERYSSGTRDPLNERYAGLGGRGWYEGLSDAMHREGPHSGRGPRNYKRADNRIEEDINDRLTQHGMIDATDVEASVQNGEVTLRGYVDNRDSKRLAEDIVESVFGVKEVNNQIKIRQRGSAEESRSETETSGKQRKAS